MNRSLNTVVDPYEIVEIKPGSFLFEIKNALNPDICQEIIRRFEAHNEDQYQGRIGQIQEENQSVKRSTDMVISNKEYWKDIDTILHRSLGLALQLFQRQYPYFKGPFKDMGYAVQRTEPGEFYHWHIDGGSHEFAYRQLVAIWYLNDIEGPGGETEFLFQQTMVKPEQGKMLLFPPFWTHEHRGVTLKREVKYIATTWVIFA